MTGNLFQNRLWVASTLFILCGSALAMLVFLRAPVPVDTSVAGAGVTGAEGQRGVGSTPARQQNSVASYSLPRTLRYRYSVRNQDYKALSNAEFWVALPIRQTASQQLKSVEASLPYTEETTAEGSAMLVFRLPRIAPRAVQVLTVTVQLEMAPAPNRVPVDNSSTYLAAAPLLETTQPAIIRLAQSLHKDSAQKTLQAIHTWVANNLFYAGYSRQPKGALYALQQRNGDCTEYAALVTALARANGIPARVVGGYVAADDSLLKASEYHNWSEFFAAGSWHIADAQKGAFMNDSDRYIAMTLDTQEGQRFGSRHPGINIRMQ